MFANRKNFEGLPGPPDRTQGRRVCSKIGSIIIVSVPMEDVFFIAAVARPPAIPMNSFLSEYCEMFAGRKFCGGANISSRPPEGRKMGAGPSHLSNTLKGCIKSTAFNRWSPRIIRGAAAAPRVQIRDFLEMFAKSSGILIPGPKITDIQIPK